MSRSLRFKVLHCLQINLKCFHHLLREKKKTRGHEEKKMWYLKSVLWESVSFSNEEIYKHSSSPQIHSVPIRQISSKSLIKPKIQNYNNKESTFYSTVYTNEPAIIYDWTVTAHRWNWKRKLFENYLISIINILKSS